MNMIPTSFYIDKTCNHYTTVAIQHTVAIHLSNIGDLTVCQLKWLRCS